MPRLDGKAVLLTGATGGIGGAIARRFLSEGANVMLVGRSAEKLEATQHDLDADGRVSRFVADATDAEATASAVAATVKTFGGLDVLVANAGTEGRVKPFETQTGDEFEDVLRTNIVGVWLAMKHAIEPMKKRGGGSIIALSSVAGVIGFPGLAAYVASKHAVYGLVKTIGIELGYRPPAPEAVTRVPVGGLEMSFALS